MQGLSAVRRFKVFLPCKEKLVAARAGTAGASGVTRKTPNGVQIRACALHTVIGRNSRRRKGLEPSRRLSETTGPQSPSAFRVVFPATEVTKRGARCKRAVAFLTHHAPAAAAAFVQVHPLPPRIGRRRTCSRTAVVHNAHVLAAQRLAVQASTIKAMSAHSPVTVRAAGNTALVTVSHSCSAPCKRQCGASFAGRAAPDPAKVKRGLLLDSIAITA